MALMKMIAAEAEEAGVMMVEAMTITATIVITMRTTTGEKYAAFQNGLFSTPVFYNLSRLAASVMCVLMSSFVWLKFGMTNVTRRGV